MASQQTNALIHEKSPYLLQHARNPVAWRPWGEAAFADAAASDRPIFLSIGYATCHWCHVMERESFEDAEVAAFLNAHFVPVKVDREERPDVDAIYMQAVVAQTGQGGWPLSVFLTPDRKPFFGGTYFPPRSRWGRPGFIDVLKSLSHAWRERRDDVRGNADWMTDHLRRAATEPGVLPEGFTTKAAEAFLKDEDAEHGGFGNAPKFPRPSILNLLVHEHGRRPDPRIESAVTRTLSAMARGGIRDQVGGGFARYSTDEKWLVPHFEKMLYDNAQLIEAYLDGWRISGARPWLHIAEETALWVASEMTHPLGGFFCAQDADSEGEEGRFYVMSPADLVAALGETDGTRAARVFGVTEEGNFEGANVLHLPHDLPDLAAEFDMTPTRFHAWLTDVRRRLRVWRHPRVHPGTDDKILLSWNGLMIAALARLGASLGTERWITAAEAAADFADAHMRTADGRFLRRWRDGDARYDAGLDDYAAMAWGRLALFSATGRARHLERAVEIADACDARFGDADGAYFTSAPSDDLLARMKEGTDGAMPSGNALIALVNARLGAMLHDESRRSRAGRTVEAFAGRIARVPQAFPLLTIVYGEISEAPRTVRVASPVADARFRDALARAHASTISGRVPVPILASEVAALGKFFKDDSALVVPASGVVEELCEDGTCRRVDDD